MNCDWLIEEDKLWLAGYGASSVYRESTAMTYLVSTTIRTNRLTALSNRAGHSRRHNTILSLTSVRGMFKMSAAVRNSAFAKIIFENQYINIARPGRRAIDAVIIVLVVTSIVIVIAQDKQQQ